MAVRSRPRYEPEPAPVNPEQLPPYVERELRRVGDSFAVFQELEIEESSSIPTEGFYDAGVIVRKSSLSIVSGFIHYGWLRLTTGEGHVDGTDWQAIYFNTTGT